MLPRRMFRSRAFVAANGVSLLMTFGMFGSIFLLAQFFQVVQGLGPLEAGLRTLPWTVMPVIVAPVAGLLATRTGTRALLVVGMALLATALGWLSLVVSPTVAYASLVPAFVMAGTGIGLFFAPIANVVLSSVRPDEEGKASGANNAIRELGGAFGVAVLATVFSANGSYASGATYVDGLTPALQVGALVVLAGAVVALALPGRVRTQSGRTTAGSGQMPAPARVPGPAGGSVGAVGVGRQEGAGRIAVQAGVHDPRILDAGLDVLPERL
jgi:MFS family permease